LSYLLIQIKDDRWVLVSMVPCNHDNRDRVGVMSYGEYPSIIFNLNE
jgi:hypothetical protein